MDIREHRASDINTRHLLANEEGALTAAAEMLKQGQLIVFPTDTLYGVGGIGMNADVVARLYQVKQRPIHKGIPILLADLEDVMKVANRVPPAAAAYIQRFWPGPLTLILPKHPNLPANISPNDGVAVRVPNNTVVRDLIRMAGGVLATSSANRSGHPPACTAAEALAELHGLVGAVLDDGPCAVRIASTIVDCRGKTPQIVREGPISAAMLSLTDTLIK